MYKRQNVLNALGKAAGSSIHITLHRRQRSVGPAARGDQLGLVAFGFLLEDQAKAAGDVYKRQVHVFLSREGYLKKITPLSLRMSGEQKYKEGDGPRQALSLIHI